MSNITARLNLKYLAILASILPASAVAWSFFIAIQSNAIPICLPLLEGCVSISKAARASDGLLLFKILMMPAAVIMAIYWIGCYQRFSEIRHSKTLSWMLFSGIVGASFLILYVNFLGTDGSFFRLARKTGVILYFAGTSFAQLLQVYWQSKTHQFQEGQCKIAQQAQFIICLILTGICFLHIWASLVPDGDLLENISEWNFALFSNMFFLFSYFSLKSLETGRTKLVINAINALNLKHQELNEEPSESEKLALLKKIPNWNIKNQRILDRSFKTKNYPSVLVTQIMNIADELNHHPLINFSYNNIDIEVTNIEVGKLTYLDFVLAFCIENISSNSFK